ncbi:MAG: hypothetical protein ACJ75Z_08215 [Solirubrobacterales bacterium]
MNIDGTVVNGITLAVATPSALALFPGQTNTSVGLVTVTSTTPSWTLSVKDSSTGYPSGHTVGHMAKLNGTGTCSLIGGFAPSLSQLNSPLSWDATATGGSSGTLTGTNQTVKNGSLVEAIPVTYSQPVSASEDLSTGDCYRVVVTYTVS